jgi:outer membrane lipoprotein-sorting protein
MQFHRPRSSVSHAALFILLLGNGLAPARGGAKHGPTHGASLDPPAAAPTTSHSDLFDEIYSRGKPVERGLRTLRARFTETTTSSLLVDPLVSEGRVVIVRPADVLIAYSAPEPRTLRMDGRELWLIWPGRGIRERQDIRATFDRVQKLFVGRTPDQLRRHFVIHASDDPPRHAWHVRMLPTRTAIKKGLASLDLWITKDTNLPASVRLTSPNGDTRTWVFRDLVINEPVSPAELQIP